MKGILMMVGITIGGAVGWWLGNMIGLMSALTLSTVGSAAGVFAVRWLEREYLD